MRARYPLRTALRLTALHRELNAQMDIRITEPVFFLGSQRRVGEVIRDVDDGPYRTQLSQTVSPQNPGGLTRIPQFVEMPEEIKTIIQDAAGAVQGAPVVAAPAVTASPPPAPTPAPGTFGEALRSIQNPAPKPVAPVNPTASLLSGLASRRRKLEQSIVSEAQAYAKELTAIESEIPQVFARASTSLSDRRASLGELDESLKDFAGSNSDPLSG